MRNSGRRRAGIVLMVASLATGMVAGGVAAVDEVPQDRVEAGENARIAFWNGDASETAPTALTKQFPPEAVCLVATQLCSFPTGDNDPTSDADPTDGAIAGAITGEEEDGGLGVVGNALIDAMNAAYGDAIDGVQDNDPGSPAEPVPEDSLPASIAFGQAYYRSAVEFPLPEVPADDQVDEFVVFLSQGNPTFSNASPALRQAVLATLTCARESGDDNPTGRCQSNEFEKVVSDSCNESKDNDGQCLRDGTPLQIEMCPIGEDPFAADPDATTKWEAGRSQDEDTLPSVNCLFGTRGIPFELEGGTIWAFDLTTALDAWADGTLPYEGVLLRPGSAENFAFGDAETTYSKQVTLLAQVEYVVSSSEAPPPPAPFEPLPAAGGFGQEQTASSDPFVTPPTPASGSPVSAPTAAQPAVAEQPAVSQPAAAPAAGGQAGDTPLAAEPAAVPQGSPWYLWLLAPVFLGGAYVFSQSLGQEVAVATAQRGGALTRLLERRTLSQAPDLVGR